MTDLFLHNDRQIRTVFDLLGDKENDITYSVGWALSQSDRLAVALLANLLPDAPSGDLQAIRLQEFLAGGGYTDIEILSDELHVIIEAKRDWTLPTYDQLAQYAPRLHGRSKSLICVMAECSPEYATRRLPPDIDGVPIAYRSWNELAGLAGTVAASAGHTEKRLLRELLRYLKGLMTMQNTTSNMVYVVSLQTSQLGESGMSFEDIVIKHDRYFHPVGGQGWPKIPPNYLGFRFHGKLQQIRHVEGYEITDEPWEEMPQLQPHVDWSPEQHFYYRLGPVIEPPRDVKMGKLWPSARVWAALDLLLTCDTVAEARDKTKARLATAGTS